MNGANMEPSSVATPSLCGFHAVASASTCAETIVENTARDHFDVPVLVQCQWYLFKLLRIRHTPTHPIVNFKGLCGMSLDDNGCFILQLQQQYYL